MALTMWGQVIIQATAPGEAPVQVGTLWIDTSSTPVVKVCTSVSPYTFAVASAVSNALLDGSAHSDTAAGTVARGDLITGQGATPKWTRLAKGALGQLLASDGTDAAWSYSNAIAFSAHNTVDQTGIVSATDTKVVAATEDFDIGGFYDAANSKWVPPAGKVKLGCVVRATNVAASANGQMRIYKNGALAASITLLAGTSGNVGWCQGEVLLDANGTDYFELYARFTGNGGANYTITSGTGECTFYGFMLR